MNYKLLILPTILVAAAGSGYAYYSYAKDKLDFQFSGIRINGMQDGVLNISLQYTIINGTGIPFTVNSADCNIYMNNSISGIATLTQPLQVPGNSTIIMDITANIKLSDIGGYAFNYLKGLVGFLGQQNQMNLSIKGNSKVEINFGWLPFEWNVPIDETFAV